MSAWSLVSKDKQVVGRHDNQLAGVQQVDKDAVELQLLLAQTDRHKAPAAVSCHRRTCDMADDAPNTDYLRLSHDSQPAYDEDCSSALGDTTTRNISRLTADRLRRRLLQHTISYDSQPAYDEDCSSALDDTIGLQHTTRQLPAVA